VVALHKVIELFVPILYISFPRVVPYKYFGAMHLQRCIIPNFYKYFGAMHLKYHIHIIKFDFRVIRFFSMYDFLLIINQLRNFFSRKQPKVILMNYLVIHNLNIKSIQNTQSTSHPINQSPNQPVNQLTNQPIKQSPVTQSTNHPINQSPNQPHYACLYSPAIVLRKTRIKVFSSIKRRTAFPSILVIRPIIPAVV
jgi:hypothetical protein